MLDARKLGERDLGDPRAGEALVQDVRPGASASRSSLRNIARSSRLAFLRVSVGTRAISSAHPASRFSFGVARGLHLPPVANLLDWDRARLTAHHAEADLYEKVGRVAKI